MKFIIQRALYCTFATHEIEGGDTVRIWHAVADLFGIPAEEQRSGEKILSNPTLAILKTVEDARLLQKCADGFGSVFRLSADEEEVLELKYQALLKIRQLAYEYRETPFKAVAAAYRRDSAAAVFYALQILIHNSKRSALGCEILSAALTSDQSGDAGLLLLNATRGDKSDVYGRLAETPEMILHPEVLEELAKRYGIEEGFADRNMRIGF